MLELPDTNSERNADTRSKAQKVMQKSEKEGRNEHKIDYDEMNPFKLVRATKNTLLTTLTIISPF